MDTLFSRLMTQVCELEGLLLVVEKHGDDTPQVVYGRIGELGQEIALYASQAAARAAEPDEHLQPQVAQPVTQPAQETQPAPAAKQAAIEPQPEPDHQPDPATAVAGPTADNDLPEQDYNADETWQHDNGEEFTEVFKVDYVEPELTIQPQPNVVLVEPHAEPEQQADESNDDEDSEDSDLRVDEKLQRTLSKDMHKALSLNDRFRFQRELFAGSKNDLNNALDLVNAMQSYDEAEEYFIRDLGWDQDNEDVAAFMGLVRRHFL